MANSKCVVLVRSNQLLWAPDTMTCCKCNRTRICKNCSCANKNSRCTNCLPCRLNKCVNISSSSTDDIDNTPETQGDTEESVSKISDGGNDPTNQQSPTNAHHDDDQCKLPDPSPIDDPDSLFLMGQFWQWDYYCSYERSLRWGGALEDKPISNSLWLGGEKLYNWISKVV